MGRHQADRHVRYARIQRGSGQRELSGRRSRRPRRDPARRQRGCGGPSRAARHRVCCGRRHGQRVRRASLPVRGDRRWARQVRPVGSRLRRLDGKERLHDRGLPEPHVRGDGEAHRELRRKPRQHARRHGRDGQGDAEEGRRGGAGSCRRHVGRQRRGGPDGARRQRHDAGAVLIQRLSVPAHRRGPDSGVCSRPIERQHVRGRRDEGDRGHSGTRQLPVAVRHRGPGRHRRVHPSHPVRRHVVGGA